jgi:hypothetical protein
MSILDIFRIDEIKAELERTRGERDFLKATLSETERMSFTELKAAISHLNLQKERLDQQIAESEAGFQQRKELHDQQLFDLNQQIQAKRVDLVEMDEEILLQSFGFYKPRYDLQNSEMYKYRLDQIRKKQAAMVKGGKAAYSTQAMTLNNSVKEGQRMMNDYAQLILRSFNNECDASIINVKFNNIESIEKKIRKAFDTLNKLGKRMNLSIAPDYLLTKLEELYLCHEYQVKKQEEKEEQKRLREQMREEAKVMKEIEEMKFKIEKEEKHFYKALATVEVQLLRASTEAEKALLKAEKNNIQQRLCEIEKNIQDIMNREKNTRAGYVYVISNVGSFGDNVYKIGVTRRLDPTERVDELGDASVPFNFDIHALIFSDDAPTLENALHKAFENRRMNLINRRREFFRASLGEIEAVIKHNYKKPVEFVELADAPEYRQSLVLKGSRSPN